ncbi:SsrA-binding protein SmpB [Leptospira meyeri]|uniref:SsrA-binding protein SmpB n=1 Tax=Leptospira meyeri TaxID=29508 RepID=UPI000C2ACA98|nr:SsrA-binding protein SmpB [Leptospira meyeri]PJZ82764.1 SsrA-binding protein [Leptospira meyeri]PJZ97997.1 SsrA-binding protein [Leptospira meyeri]PKA11885.1 SsrA-binding protein [Leptospira meyeri]TGL16615.1 SsrA-binding protein SmpB [Leptospira meyeri]
MGKTKKDDKPRGTDPLINKKAKFNFELLDSFEAGVVLTGSEVKSLREKKGNLTDCFAKVRNGEVFLENFQIPPYKNGGYANHPEIRPRKLLLKAKEIEKIDRSIKEKGLVLVATRCFFKNNRLVKIDIALAKPKKLYDKRDDIQKKEAKIDMERAMKEHLRR